GGRAGMLGRVGFDPSNDAIVLQQALQNTNPPACMTILSTGNAVITFQNDAQDQITLVGVHSSALHVERLSFGLRLSFPAMLARLKIKKRASGFPTCLAMLERAAAIQFLSSSATRSDVILV